MHKTITPGEMRRVETLVMERTDITGEMLMERAAAQVARTVARLCAGRPGTVICVCGTGNNGGDGLAAMRMLAEGDESFSGECWILQGELSPDARRELGKLQESAGGKRIALRRLEGEAPPALPEHTRCVIDAMFGTGLSRPLVGMAAALCQTVNASGVQVVAVDIPSGLNGETGVVMGAAIRASKTVTFHRPKPGLYLGEGPDCAGCVSVADIGLSSPPAANLDDANGFFVLEERDLPALLPSRRRVSHKGSYGRVLLWTGSTGMAGAAAICATAALRSGAGLVTVACPEEIVGIVQTLCPCATCIPLPGNDAGRAWALLEEALESASALGAGCGLGKGAVAAALLNRLLAYLAAHELPAVLDADALNLLAALPGTSAGGTLNLPLSHVVLTPHPAEAARLLGRETAEIVRDPVNAAHCLRNRFGAAAVLKGASSVLAAPEGLGLNPFGTPAMAKGGSGDALTGVLAALLAGRRAGAYAVNDLQLLQAACALHGLAGEAAEKRFGERGMLATDLCEYLGAVGGGLCARRLNDEDGRPLEKCAGNLPAQSASERCGSVKAPEIIDSEPEAAWRDSPLGKTVAVTVDRRLGTKHPEHQELEYLLNYGYVQDVLAADNEWQDAYLYGVTTPVEWFEGEVIAVVHRLNDVEDKWVVAAPGTRATELEIRRAVDFQERFFETEIEVLR